MSEYSKEPVYENRDADGGIFTRTPLLEWIAAGVGLALVAGAIGFMLYRAIAGDSSPPDIAVQVDAVRPTSSGYLVTFVVTNRGELAAAGLTIEGELSNDTQSVEISAATIDYVPSRSQRRGGLFFTRNPEQFELRLRAKGYERP